MDKNELYQLLLSADDNIIAIIEELLTMSESQIESLE